MSVPEWSEREDGQRKGGLSKPAVKDGKPCEETLWNVSVHWPTKGVGRMVLREYGGGITTVQLGRIWPTYEEEEDGA